MSIVQLNQIKQRVEPVGALVDVSDVQESEKDITRLTRGLGAWVIVQLAGASEDEAAACVTDGFGDNGIDAIHVDIEDSQVYVVQMKWDHKGTGSPDLGDVHKFIQGFRDLVNAEFERFNQKIQDHQAELETALSDPNVKFTLILAHTGQNPLSDQARTVIDDLLAELNDPIPTASFEMLTQVELHSFLTRGVHGEPPDLSVTMHNWGTIQDPYTAYYGQVEASAVAEWYAKHGVRLFRKNIRQFLGNDTGVNTSIIETLKANPQHFWYLNNGVTVLCERVAKSALGGASKQTGYFEFARVSVVNGAQTVGCIGRAAAEDPEAVADARVTIRFISLENCPEEFASDVTRGTNTQNRVERLDFVALDPEQDRLANDLAVEGIRYAIKSGESTPAPETGCTVTEATIALACAKPVSDLAVQAKREIGRLWIGAEDEGSTGQYRQIFGKSVTSEQVWRSVRVLRAIDAALVTARDQKSGKDRMIGIHGNRLIAHRVFQRLDSGALTDPASDFEAVLASVPGFVTEEFEETIAEVKANFASNYVASLFKNAARCRDLSKAVAKRISTAHAASA